MKVCLVTGEYPPMPGGVGDYTFQLGRALQQLAVSVSVLAPRQAALASRRAEDPALLPWVDHWNYASWRTVRRAIAETHCDVLNIQYQTGAYAMHPAINLLPLRFRSNSGRPRIVTTFHDLRVPYLFPKAGRVRSLVNRLLLQHSDAAVLTNVADFLEAARRQIGERGIPTGRANVGHYHLVPIGSNIDVNPPADFDRLSWRQKLGLSPQETLLSYFGLLNRSKGFDTLLRALRQALDRQLRVKLIVVGGDVGQSDPTNLPYREELRGLIGELGLDPHLIWTGHCAAREVSAHLLASDICVLPFLDGVSFRRGSLMAALLHGLPLISTNPQSPDLAEWETRLGQPAIVDGKQALLVPPDDVEAIAEAIVTLASSPSLRQELGTGARSLAEQFTWPAIAQRTLEIYREICS